MLRSNYQPIDCNYYDELVLLAMRKKVCEIIFLDKNDQQQRKQAIIKDIYTREKVEYLRLDDDQEIRLDRLIAADGKQNGPLNCRI